MHVLAVTYEASRTGSVVSFIQALEAMTERGVKVTTVVKARGPMLGEISARSARVLVEPKRLTCQLKRVSRLGALSGVVPRVERHIARRTVRDLSPDCVYASTVLSSEYAAVAVNLGIPTVLHVHEQEPLVTWAFDRARLPTAGLAIVCPSAFVRDELRAHGVRVLGVLPGPVSTPRTSPIPVYSWQPDAYRVLACGSAATWKGTAEWLQVASRLRALGTRPVEWVWVGPGDLPALRAETEWQGLAGVVHWVGEQPSCGPWLAGADLVVVPSRQETLGLVAVEAAAVGTPAVGFDVGGLPTVLPDPRARVPAGDVVALADRVAEVLGSPELRDELVRSTRSVLDSARAQAWRRDLAECLLEEFGQPGGPGPAAGRQRLGSVRLRPVGVGLIPGRSG